MTARQFYPRCATITENLLRAIDGEYVGGSDGVSCEFEECDESIGGDERVMAYIIRDASNDIRPMNFFCTAHEGDVEIRDLTTMGTGGAMVTVDLVEDITGGLEIDTADAEILEQLGEISTE